MFVAQGNQIFMNDVFLKRLTAPTITSGGSPPVFSLTSDGKLTAKNADISGSVNANSGTLNNVTINQNCTIKGMLEATQVRGDFVKAVSKSFPKQAGTWGNTETPNGTVTVTTLAAEAAREKGLDNKWLIPLLNTTQQPALAEMRDRATREKLFIAGWTRAEKNDGNDTRAIIQRLVEIRAQQAKLLGFPHYAAWKIADQMAKTPEAALNFMREIVPAARQRASDELASIQAVIDKQQGGFSAQPWDWAFYAEQVRREKFDLDVELNTVLNEGVFWTANQLFGIKFVERFDIPVYHPDVRVWEIFDHNGVGLALFYGDFFARDSKSGGAWMGNFVEQSTLNETYPVIYNVCNYQKPAAGEPALLLWDDVITLFHEFGHTLHGLFARQRYATLSAPSCR